MYRLILPPKFKKQFRDFLKRHPELRKAVEEKFFILEKNPRDPRLKTHKLSGALKGFLAASITNEYRIVFHFSEGGILLFAIGTHDEVY